MHIKNSLFLFFKNPALFILFSSCFYIPQSFSWWERVDSYDHIEDSYEKIMKYIWDPDQFPIKLCVDWDDFYPYERKWIRKGVKIWNNAFKDYRKRKDSENYFNELGNIGITEPLFKISCRGYLIKTNVIPIDKKGIGFPVARVKSFYIPIWPGTVVALAMSDKEKYKDVFLYSFTHELGHVLGLGHDKDDFLMYPTTEGCKDADINNCIYPSDDIIKKFMKPYLNFLQQVGPVCRTSSFPLIVPCELI